jgi:hypothetical protein
VSKVHSPALAKKLICYGQETSSDWSTTHVVALEEEHVNELNGSQEDSFAVIIELVDIDVVLVGHGEALVNTWEMLLLESTNLGVSSSTTGNFEVQSLGWTAASAHFTEERVTVACALLDGPELVLFGGTFTLVTVNLDLANVLWVAWEFNSSDDTTAGVLHNNFWSVAAHPCEQISTSETFVGVIGLSTNLDLTVGGSGTWHANASAEERRVFWKFSLFISGFVLHDVDVVAGEARNGRGTDAVSAVNLLFNSVLMVAHCSNFIS